MTRLSITLVFLVITLMVSIAGAALILLIVAWKPGSPFVPKGTPRDISAPAGVEVEQSETVAHCRPVDWKAVPYSFKIDWSRE